MLTKTPSLTSLIICIIFIVQANINGQISSGITTNKATVDLTKIKQEEAPAIKSSEIKIDFGQDRHFESAEGFVFTANGMKVSPSQRSATLISKPIEIPIQTPEPFLSVGCVWTVENIDQENMSLAIRGSSDGKAWGEWLKVTKDDDLSSSPNESFGHLIFLDQKTSYLQYRISLQQRNSALSPNLKRLRLACISPGKTPAAAIETIRKQHEVEAQHKTLGLSSFPMPSVTSRTTWGCPDGQSSPAWSPQYTSVSHLIIHHTDNPNTLTDWAAVVKSIWQFHTVTRGWGDIGYNYLVDPNGVIYEGRAGGDNVIGAHFSCANTNTMGVAALGTFTTVSPASNALTSIKNLLAWKSDQLGINPLGTAYHNLTQLSLYNISGHRDSNPTAAPGTCPTATVCPGDNLYSQLPNIRAAVKDLLTPIVNVTFTTVPAGLQILVDGIFYTTPKTFNWQSGAVHVATASSPQSGPAGTQYVYSSWSDGQPQTRLITTPLESNTTFTANYTTQHYLTMAAGTGGGISPPSNWYNNGQNVQIEATPNDNYNFANWTGSGTGSYTGTNNPATVTMNGPITQTASFAPIATTRTLTVASSSPSSGINIIVSPNDNNGQGNGTTQFSRTYDKDKTVTLIAPSAAGGNNFQKWSRNGVDWSTNQTTNVNILMFGI